MNKNKLNPVHPGEVLLEEFIKPMKLTPLEMANHLNIPLDTIEKIIVGKEPISAEIALRLARYFNMSPQFWLGLQMDYDLDIAEDQKGKQIELEVICYAQ